MLTSDRDSAAHIAAAEVGTADSAPADGTTALPSRRVTAPRVMGPRIPATPRRMTEGALEFRRVADGGWLVRRMDRPAGDGTAVLGFVETDGDGYAVTSLARPERREHVASFDSAIAAFSEANRATRASPAENWLG